MIPTHDPPHRRHRRRARDAGFARTLTPGDPPSGTHRGPGGQIAGPAARSHAALASLASVLGALRGGLWPAALPGSLVVPVLVSLLGSLLLADPAPAQPVLRVAAYNIKHGRGMDGEVDLERVADVLRRIDADVVMLQEVDRGTERTAGVDQPAVLARLTGMEPSFGAHRPYQGGEYGNAVLSRLPVLEARTHAIAPSQGSALTVHEVVVAVGDEGRPVSVVSVHLAGSDEVRLQQVDSLRVHFARADHPVTLAGDFNSRRGDPVLNRLMRHWTVLPKSGPATTFPSDAPDREIDYVLFRPAGAFEVFEHRVIDESVASDHRPLLAVLRLR